MSDERDELFSDWLTLDAASLPDPKLGPYLTTNSPSSRTIYGMATHVYLVSMFHKSQGPEGPVFSFSDSDIKIWGCKLYKPVFAYTSRNGAGK
jgi:hypothetical protein